MPDRAKVMKIIVVVAVVVALIIGVSMLKGTPATLPKA